MALLTCPECSREVSDQAETCPNCGFPIANHLEKQKNELLKQEAEEEQKVKQLEIAEAKRIKEEKLQAAYQEAQRINKAAAAQMPTSKHSKPNYKFIFSFVGIIALITIYSTYSNIKNAEAEGRQKLVQKISMFNSVKKQIESKSLPDDKLQEARVTVESIDTSMPVNRL